MAEVDAATLHQQSAGRAKRAARACNHCRWKRLKCSDQLQNESCMNCLIYGTKCEYTSKWPAPNGKRKERSEGPDTSIKSRKKHRSMSDVKIDSGEEYYVETQRSVRFLSSPRSSEDQDLEETKSNQPARMRSIDVTSVIRIDHDKEVHATDQNCTPMLVADELGLTLAQYLTPLTPGISEDDVITMEDSSLPRREVIDALVDAYFDHVAPLWPIIDERDFRTDLSSSNYGSQSVDTLFPLLLRVVMCVGAVAVRDRTGFSDDITNIRDTLYKQVSARSLFLYSLPTLRNLQCLVLITLYFVQLKKLQAAWSWCRWGIRMQRYFLYRQKMNIHTEEDANTQEPRDFVTWTLFIIESQMSLLQFHDDPRLTESMVRHPSEEIRKRFPIFCHRLELARISHKLSGIYLDSAPEAMAIMNLIDEMYTSIAAWKENVPPKYRPESRVFTEDAEYKSVLLMHLEYHTLVLTMFTALGAGSKFPGTPASLSSKHPSFAVRNQVAVRVNNARYLLGTIDAIAEASHVKPCVSSWLSLAQILGPFSFIYTHIIRRPGLNTVHSDVQILHNTLQHFSDYVLDSPRNTHIRSLLTAMYAAAAEIVANEANKLQTEALIARVNADAIPIAGPFAPSASNSSSQDHSFDKPSPSKAEFDYSPTLPSGANRESFASHQRFVQFPEATGFGAEVSLARGPDSTNRPFVNEQDAAAWLASQQQGAMPYMAMLGNEWDEWWWQQGEGGPAGPGPGPGDGRTWLP